MHTKSIDGWRISSFLVALTVIVPLSVILLSFLHPEKEIWAHIIKNLLSDLLLNTLWLVIGVFTVTLILGVGLAWITAVCDYPGRKIFSWALLLPLAMPAYVLAFVSLGLFDYSGPVQSYLRDTLGADSSWIPDIRSTGGVIIVLSLALYPYVYLISRNAFLTQGRRALEAAQSLGYSRVSGFFRVALPMARPWIVGGLMLVVMEALADFGAVSIFNYDTFTTAIYKAWFGLFSVAAAAQLSSILVIIVFIIILIEQKMRSKMRFHQTGRHPAMAERIRLKGIYGWAAFLFSFLVMMAAFIIPVAQLTVWTLNVFADEFNSRYIDFTLHSLSLGTIATVLICLCALILSYSKRHHPDKLSGFFVRVSTLGYALPGTVLAVGIFIPIAFADNLLAGIYQGVFGLESGPVLQGTLLVMILAFLVRFMAAGFNPVGSSMERVTKSIDEAAKGMGYKGIALIAGVHIPILKGGLLTAATLVFVDVMKEMPITLMTRPFGWDTLSVKIYELTSEGEWERAALPAVVLILVGLLPVILLTRHGENE